MAAERKPFRHRTCSEEFDAAWRRREPGLLAAVVMLVCLGVARAAPVAESRHGMVVSAQHLASEVGAEILKAGGNAVDAAVAVGYALAVVDPCCGNIGGGGFMLIRRADDSRTVIDFRERAPLAARPDMYLDPSGAVRPEASLQRLSGGRGARHGDGARHGAAEIRKAGPRQGDGAGDRAGARRVRPRRGGCRDHRLARRASRARQGGGAHFSAPGRIALPGRRPARPARSGRDAGADRRAGAGGVLSRPGRRRGRRRRGRAWRDSDKGGFRRSITSPKRSRCSASIAASWSIRRRRRAPAARFCARCCKSSPAGIRGCSATGRRGRST